MFIKKATSHSRGKSTWCLFNQKVVSFPCNNEMQCNLKCKCLFVSWNCLFKNTTREKKEQVKSIKNSMNKIRSSCRVVHFYNQPPADCERPVGFNAPSRSCISRQMDYNPLVLTFSFAYQDLSLLLLLQQFLLRFIVWLWSFFFCGFVVKRTSQKTVEMIIPLDR